MIEIGEIVFCNLTILKKNVKNTLKEVVYKEKDGYYKGFKVIDIEIIKRLGFENKNKGFDLAVKNQEQRNNITGAYE
jgi:hypothetical protein